MYFLETPKTRGVLLSRPFLRGDDPPKTTTTEGNTIEIAGQTAGFFHPRTASPRRPPISASRKCNGTGAGKASSFEKWRTQARPPKKGKLGNTTNKTENITGNVMGM